MCACVRREIRGQPPTRDRTEKEPTVASDVSTKRVTQYRTVRTFWHNEFAICTCQILRQRRLLLQHQHQHRCQTLGDLSHGSDSSNLNTFVVLFVVQVLQPSEEPRTTAGVLDRVLRCVASLAFSPADDMMNVERDPACVSASRRRRDQRLRSYWRHECVTVRMALATAAHHSSKRVSSASTQTEYVAAAPVTEYVAHRLHPVMHQHK